MAVQLKDLPPVKAVVNRSTKAKFQGSELTDAVLKHAHNNRDQFAFIYEGDSFGSAVDDGTSVPAMDSDALLTQGITMTASDEDRPPSFDGKGNELPEKLDARTLAKKKPEELKRIGASWGIAFDEMSPPTSSEMVDMILQAQDEE